MRVMVLPGAWGREMGEKFKGAWNLPANAGEVRDAGSIPGSGISLEEVMATCSSILAWRTSWREEPGRLRSIGSKRGGMTEVT